MQCFLGPRCPAGGLCRHWHRHRLLCAGHQGGGCVSSDAPLLDEGDGQGAVGASQDLDPCWTVRFQPSPQQPVRGRMFMKSRVFRQAGALREEPGRRAHASQCLLTAAAFTKALASGSSQWAEAAHPLEDAVRKPRCVEEEQLHLSNEAGPHHPCLKPAAFPQGAVPVPPWILTAAVCQAFLMSPPLPTALDSRRPRLCRRWPAPRPAFPELCRSRVNP